MSTPERTRVTQPILNEMGGFHSDDVLRYVAKKLMAYVRNMPELIGMLDTLVTDHFMGDIDFFATNGKLLGSTNLSKAKNSWIKLNIDDTFYGMGVDFFVDGNCFGWHQSPENGLNETQKQAINEFDVALKGTNLGGLGKQLMQEPKKISYLAASTTEILHDQFSITGFKQEASGIQTIWSPEQIVHIKLMEFNGEVRGFSGIKSLVKEITMMFMLKENILAKLQNGGSMDNIIYLKGNKMGVSKGRFERFRTALESFSHLKKSHGNMPIESEVGVVPMGTSLKDMEYRELAMFVISEFALAIGFPTSRMNFIMTGQGGSTSKGELSGTTEDAYQKKINNRRRKWENGWNTVFEKLGFNYKFRRDNLQDEVRETTASTQRAAYVSKVQEVLLKQKKMLKEDTLLQLLSASKMNIGTEDIEDAPEELFTNGEEMNDGSGIKKQDGAFQSNKAQLKSKKSSDKSAAKKATANNNGVFV